MQLETLKYEIDRAVATVTLNRPEKRNAINRTMFEELEQVFVEIGRSNEVRAFVLTGEGDHFCSGADISALDESPTSAPQMIKRMDQIHSMLRALFYCPKPGIAKVRGHAAGGGANLALACDLVVMDETAKFSELFVKRALVVDMSGTFTLPRAIGLHRAKELALLGDTVDAQRAYEIGIANRVVAPDELDAVVDELALRLATSPPLSLAFMKQAMNDSFSMSFDEVLAQESLHQTIMISTADVAEAIQAFFQKRDPNFTGE